MRTCWVIILGKTIYLCNQCNVLVLQSSHKVCTVNHHLLEIRMRQSSLKIVKNLTFNLCHYQVMFVLRHFILRALYVWPQNTCIVCYIQTTAYNSIYVKSHSINMKIQPLTATTAIWQFGLQKPVASL